MEKGPSAMIDVTESGSISLISVSKKTPKCQRRHADAN